MNYNYTGSFGLTFIRSAYLGSFGLLEWLYNSFVNQIFESFVSNLEFFICSLLEIKHNFLAQVSTDLQKSFFSFWKLYVIKLIAAVWWKFTEQMRGVIIWWFAFRGRAILLLTLNFSSSTTIKLRLSNIRQFTRCFSLYIQRFCMSYLFFIGTWIVFHVIFNLKWG